MAGLAGHGRAISACSDLRHPLEEAGNVRALATGDQNPVYPSTRASTPTLLEACKRQQASVTPSPEGWLKPTLRDPNKPPITLGSANATHWQAFPNAEEPLHRQPSRLQSPFQSDTSETEHHEPPNTLYLVHEGTQLPDTMLLAEEMTRAAGLPGTCHDAIRGVCEHHEVIEAKLSWIPSMSVLQQDTTGASNYFNRIYVRLKKRSWRRRNADHGSDVSIDQPRPRTRRGQYYEQQTSDSYVDEELYRLNNSCAPRNSTFDQSDCTMSTDMSSYPTIPVQHVDIPIREPDLFSTFHVLKERVHKLETNVAELEGHLALYAAYMSNLQAQQAHEFSLSRKKICHTPPEVHPVHPSARENVQGVDDCRIQPIEVLPPGHPEAGISCETTGNSKSDTSGCYNATISSLPTEQAALIRRHTMVSRHRMQTRRPSLCKTQSAPVSTATSRSNGSLSSSPYTSTNVSSRSTMRDMYKLNVSPQGSSSKESPRAQPRNQPVVSADISVDPARSQHWHSQSRRSGPSNQGSKCSVLRSSDSGSPSYDNNASQRAFAHSVRHLRQVYEDHRAQAHVIPKRQINGNVHPCQGSNTNGGTLIFPQRLIAPRIGQKTSRIRSGLKLSCGSMMVGPPSPQPFPEEESDQEASPWEHSSTQGRPLSTNTAFHVGKVA